MPRRHLKSIALQELERSGPQWDYELATTIMGELNVSGPYWFGTIRAMLADLDSGGLITECDAAADPGKSFGKPKLLLKFRLTDFGHDRMTQSGLKGGTSDD